MQTASSASCLWAPINRSRLRTQSQVSSDDWSMCPLPEINWVPRNTRRWQSRSNLSSVRLLIIVRKSIWRIRADTMIIFPWRCSVHLMISITSLSIRIMYLRKKMGQPWKPHGRCTKPTVTMPRSGSRSHRGCSKRNLKTIFMIFRNALIWMMELGLEAITSGSGQKNLKKKL